MKFKSVIISGAMAQDHEFIYPFYRLLEAGSELDVCLIGGKPVQGFLGTTLPPNKGFPVKDISEIKVEGLKNQNAVSSTYSFIVKQEKQLTVA